MIECEINGVKLKCYENGDIEYFHLKYKHWRKSSNVLNSYGYKQIRLNRKLYKQHRVIYKAFNTEFDINNSKLEIDHINRITYDNRIENLRVVNQQQNTFNRNNTKGYTFDKNKNRWQGQITVNGKRISKYFDTEIEASEWYLVQKKILHIFN